MVERRNRELGSHPIGVAVLAIVASAGSVVSGSQSEVHDWPQFRGPARDGVSTEVHISDSWPEAGPPVVWRRPTGQGYAGMAVRDGLLFTMDGEGPDEVILALRADTGEEVWRVRSDAKIVTARGNGPRATPTVDEGVVYTVGGRGKLYALDAERGDQLWHRDLESEFAVSRPFWGTASSPLVEGDLVVIQVGGRDGHAFAAFDKRTGHLRWASQSDQAAYSSPLALTLDGLRQIVFLGADALVSLRPEDGQLLWRVPWATHLGINVASPVPVPPDGVFISAAYDMGGALVSVRAAPDGATARVVWSTRRMKNLFHSSVYHEGHLFGFDDAIFKSIDATNGEERWRTRGFGHGSLIAVGDRLVVLSEDGELAIVEANPERYREVVRAQIVDSRTWTPPSLAYGLLFVRSDDELVCLDLKPSLRKSQVRNLR